MTDDLGQIEELMKEKPKANLIWVCAGCGCNINIGDEYAQCEKHGDICCFPCFKGTRIEHNDAEGNLLSISDEWYKCKKAPKASIMPSDNNSGMPHCIVRKKTRET